MKMFISKSEEETFEFAEKFAHKLRGGEVIGLIGELGAGKTVFVKGLARGLGIKKIIHSPTFLLMKVYEVEKESSRKVGGKATPSRRIQIKFLVHVDAYRLMGADELIDIGFLDWLNKKDTVTVVEWADKVKELLRGKKIIKIKFELDKRKEERIIKVIK